MNKKVGVKFKTTGKVYDFSCGAFVLNPGDHVIVETEQGLGMGTVTVGPQEYKDKSSGRSLKKVYRLANEKDFKQHEKNLADENEAHSYCLDCIKELGLKMNLFSVEKSFDGNKYIFFFTSEGRVDFRQQQVDAWSDWSLKKFADSAVCQSQFLTRGQPSETAN